MNKDQKKILITGASGFIGRALCEWFAENYSVIGVDNIMRYNSYNIAFDIIDITDRGSVFELVKQHNPDIILHCAGIAHQKMGGITKDEYLAVNSIATENLANIAIELNAHIHFVFLSSISVYGEEKSYEAASEEHLCRPSSDYAFSKLDAEKRLMKLHDSGKLKKLDILRLAPVYDSKWSLNLDRRVFAPKKVVYIKFGSGEQEMSAVSKQNIVEFIEYRLNQEQENSAGSFYNTFNVCDAKPYKFKEIIRIFKGSDCQPNRLVFTIPLVFVWAVTRFAGLIYKNKRQWLYSCYEKLANDLVFNNEKMLDTGFKPVHTLRTSF